MALFKKGYDSVREEKKRQEEAREKMNKRLFRFFLTGDGAEARVRFLTEEPINFYEHTIKTFKGGKERYDNVLCCGNDEGCPYCEDGDKPSFKGAFLVWDYTPFEAKDKNGKKKKVNGSLKLYVGGTRVLSQLDRLSSRYGLTSRDYEISRTGTGTETSYMFERTDDVSKLTKAQITNMLPDKIAEDFDGSMESLYTIIENQLKLGLPDTKDFEDDEDEEEDGEEYNSRKNLVGIEDEEDEEDEEEKPKKKTMLKRGQKSSVKGLFKKK